MDLEIEAADQGVPDIRAALETLKSNGQAAAATLSLAVSMAGCCPGHCFLPLWRSLGGRILVHASELPAAACASLYCRAGMWRR